MQLLNPQQEHALPEAMTRLSAYLYWGGGGSSDVGVNWMGARVLEVGDGVRGCTCGG